MSGKKLVLGALKKMERYEVSALSFVYATFVGLIVLRVWSDLAKVLF